MNFWKIAFFTLLGILVAGAAYVLILFGIHGDSDPIPEGERSEQPANSLTVKATKMDLEGIANTYINKAMSEEPLPVTLEVADDIILASELTVFSYKVPVVMHFEPIVRADGNLTLKQTNVEIGKLNLPPATILKVLKDSVKLPPWMIVRPKEEEVFIDLNALPISGDIQVKAKEFNLDEDEIILEIIIPKE